MEAVSDSVINFSWDLFRLMCSNPKENYLISPVSIVAALSMTLTGARGKTAKEMISGLHYASLCGAPDSSNDHLHESVGAALKAATHADTLHMANRIYTEQHFPLTDSFVSLVKKAYDSAILPVDFKHNAPKVCKEINSWVAEHTHNKIKDIIPESSLDHLTRMVLVNAVYFKGEWQKQFNPKDTIPDTFHMTPEENMRVQMMFIKEKMRYTANFSEDDSVGPSRAKIGANDHPIPKFQAAALPFKQSANSQASLYFVVILPHDMQEFDAAIKEKSSTLAKDGAWLKNILHELFVNQQRSNIEVNLKLPRFKLAPEGGSIKQSLINLGMKNMFEDNADFSGFSSGPEPIGADEVFHKAMMEVNEEGAEAAAATAVVMKLRCAVISAPPISMTVNKPCFVLIVDGGLKLPLFFGKLYSPKE